MHCAARLLYLLTMMNVSSALQTHFADCRTQPASHEHERRLFSIAEAFSCIAGKGKVLAYTGVPADLSKRMPAGNWLKVALEVLGGKGGGKPTNAQGQGPDIEKLPEAMQAAKEYANKTLS